STQFLDAAQGNDNAVYTGNLTLDATDVMFGLRDDGSYTFKYEANANNEAATLTTEGVVYFDGNLTTNKEINYQHGSYGDPVTNYTKSTIFVSGKITIKDEILAIGTYPSESVMAFVNEDTGTSTDDDIHIDVTSQNSVIQSFIYTSGWVTIDKQVKIHGSVMTKMLNLNEVPDLEAPDDSVKDNYPYLFPGKDLAFITTSNWREVPVTP
ncbi:hypothetical protein LCGC14_1843300, partial [marine sediment metagenome]